MCRDRTALLHLRSCVGMPFRARARRIVMMRCRADSGFARSPLLWVSRSAHFFVYGSGDGYRNFEFYKFGLIGQSVW